MSDVKRKRLVKLSDDGTLMVLAPVAQDDGSTKEQQVKVDYTLQAAILPLLQAYAFRNLIARAVGIAQEAKGDVLEAARKAIASINDASIFERKARESTLVPNLITVLAKVKGVSEDAVRNMIEQQQAAMSDEDFTKWTKAVRIHPDVKPIYDATFPTEPRKPRKRKTLDELFAPKAEESKAE